MQASMLLCRTWITIVLLFTSVVAYGALDSVEQMEQDARDYRARVQQAADVVIVPRLLQALSREELKRLGLFRVDVVASRDSLRLSLEARAADDTRLVVSIGHIFVHDLLVDASLAWTLAENEEALMSYAIEVTRFALSARDPATKVAQPEPFWRLLGWSDKKYESLQTNPEYEKYLAHSRMRSFAWIVARAITMRLSNDVPPTLATRSVEEEARILARTSELLMQAGFSPIPALGSTIFFYGVQHRGHDSQRSWLCSAKQVYDAAIPVLEQGRKDAFEAPSETKDTAIGEWRRMRDALADRGECTGG